MLSKIPKAELEAYLLLLEKIRTTEQEIAKSEFPFRALLDVVPFGIYITDELNLPFYVNRVAYKLLKGIIIGPEDDPVHISERIGLYQAGTNSFYPLENLPTRKARQHGVIGTVYSIDDIEVGYSDEKVPIVVHSFLWIDPNSEKMHTITLFWSKCGATLEHFV